MPASSRLLSWEPTEHRFLEQPFVGPMFDEADRMAFDIAIQHFGETTENMLMEMVDKPAPAPKRGGHTVRVPKYTLAELLGLGEDEETDEDAPRLDLSRYLVAESEPDGDEGW